MIWAVPAGALPSGDGVRVGCYFPFDTMTHPTKQQLLDVGMGMLLHQGYNKLGIESLLQATNIPRGSFYHHFANKEDFALAAIDAYMVQVHATLDRCLSDTRRKPLSRIRRFFENTRDTYAQQGYMGCLLGGLGQELAGVSDVFRRKVAGCFDSIATRLGECLELAKEEGQLASNADTLALAHLLVDSWEGAALRSRLNRNDAPLTEMLDFCLASAAAAPPKRRSRARKSAR